MYETAFADHPQRHMILTSIIKETDKIIFEEMMAVINGEFETGVATVDKSALAPCHETCHLWEGNRES